MRSSSPEYLETAIMSDNTVLSALSCTDSDSAPLASLQMAPAAQLERPASTPTARSIARRRRLSTVRRTSGSCAHLRAVSLGTLFARAQRRMELPRARATASENLLHSRGSSDIGLIGPRWQEVFHRVSVRLTRASQPAARSNGTPSMDKGYDRRAAHTSACAGRSPVTLHPPPSTISLFASLAVLSPRPRLAGNALEGRQRNERRAVHIVRDVAWTARAIGARHVYNML